LARIRLSTSYTLSVSTKLYIGFFIFNLYIISNFIYKLPAIVYKSIIICKGYNSPYKQGSEALFRSYKHQVPSNPQHKPEQLHRSSLDNTCPSSTDLQLSNLSRLSLSTSDNTYLCFGLDKLITFLLVETTTPNIRQSSTWTTSFACKLTQSLRGLCTI